MAYRFPWGTHLRKTTGTWLRESADALVSVSFPAACRICEQVLRTSSRIPICQACLDSFQKVPPCLCEKCGEPLEHFPTPANASPESTSGPHLLCGVCRVRTYSFERARSFGIYKDSLVHAILLLKFERIEPLGCWFAKRLHEIISSEPSVLTAEVVVPVPLHRSRLKERGYNQADFIAKPLAKRLGLPYRPFPSYANPPQTGQTSPHLR